MTHGHAGPFNDNGSLGVHITGSDVDFAAPRTTIEREPEHWVIRTAVIPPYTEAQEGGATGAPEAGLGYEQVLSLDLLRKDAVLYFPDGPVVLCHSAAQAANVANYGATVPFPEGGYFPQGSNTPNLSGTGPMWAVNVNGGAVSQATPSQPAVPATGVAQQNTNPYPVQVVINANGATITNVSVNGVTVGTGAGTYVVPAYGSISIAYSVATPTWVWSNTNASIAAGPVRITIVTNRRGA